KSQKKKYKNSLNRINELVEMTKHLDNVVPLIKTVSSYKGIVFAGDVMWYLPKGSKDWSFFKNVSNDSNYIFDGQSKEDMVYDMWKESIGWYNSLQNVDMDIFVSHVPPVHSPYSI